MSECTGACCIVFPVNSTYKGFADMFLRGTADAQRIATMVRPLTLDEAQGRWRALAGAELPEHYSDLALYTCSFYDTKTSRCTDYEHRPDMCSDCPYAAACEHCGYVEAGFEERRRERRKTDFASAYAWDRAGGYRALAGHKLKALPPDWFIEGELLKPAPRDDGQVWDPSDFEWKKALPEATSRAQD